MAAGLRASSTVAAVTPGGPDTGRQKASRRLRCWWCDTSPRCCWTSTAHWSTSVTRSDHAGSTTSPGSWACHWVSVSSTGATPR
jgi:hypothetical protein